MSPNETPTKGTEMQPSRLGIKGAGMMALVAAMGGVSAFPDLRNHRPVKEPTPEEIEKQKELEAAKIINAIAKRNRKNEKRLREQK